MRRSALLVAAASFAATAAGCAAPSDRETVAVASAAGGGRCFYTSDVTGFRAPTNEAIFVGTARGETFRLDTLVNCSAARSARTIGFRTLAGDRVCEGMDVAVLVPGAGVGGTCPVSRVTPLSPEQVAALSAEERP